MRPGAVVLCAAGAAAVVVGLLVWRPWESREAPGRYVVRVLDLDGKPVEAAQVQAKYAPGWVGTRSDGVATLRAVPLRADEREAPETLGAAIEARAPFFSMRGRAPEVVRDAAGTWTATFRLESHGVLRITVAPSRYTNVRAWVIPDPVLQRLEAMDGRDVARPMEAAAWRVYRGMEKLDVRLVGDEGVAWRRLLVDPPSPGFLREVEFATERAQAIVGSLVLPAEGPERPPTAAGRVEVVELMSDGSRVPRDPVVLADDGGFSVPYVGEGTFELRVLPDLYEPSISVTAKAGAFAEIGAGVPRPWLDATVEGVSEEEGKQAVVLAVEPSATAVPQVHRIGHGSEGGLHRFGPRFVCALPRHAARLGVRFDVPGSDARPPRMGHARVEVGASGRVAATIPLADAPAGTVVVRLLPGEVESRRAVVTLPDRWRRERTVAVALQPEVRFENVEIGRQHVSVDWGETAARSQAYALVSAGETTTLDMTPVRGGYVELEGRGSGVVGDAADRSLRWDEQRGFVRMKRVPGTTRWRSEGRVPVGRYEALVFGLRGQEDAVTLEIRADETTVGSFHVP